MSSSSSSLSSDSSEISIGQEMLFDSSSSSEDESNKNRHCIENYEAVISEYSEKEFVKHFRLRRDVVNQLILQFSESVHYTSILNDFGRDAISPEKHLYTFLWFVGHEVSSYRDCADRFDLSLSALFEIITRVSNYLVDIAPQHIRWPNEEEKELTKLYFQQVKGFPNVIGCIDGTHIRIDRPKESAESYYNRKDFFSIQMQIVSNHERKIIDVFIGFPGSVHDARIFRNSPLFEKLLNPELCGWLLGDSAYPCLPTLMTPYKDNGHLTAAETLYNAKLSSCRVQVEHTIGILKQRFRFLYHTKLRNIQRRIKVIYACCVLHNMCSTDDLDLLDQCPANEIIGNMQVNVNQENHQINDDLPSGLALRNELRDNLWNH